MEQLYHKHYERVSSIQDAVNNAIHSLPFPPEALATDKRRKSLIDKMKKEMLKEAIAAFKAGAKEGQIYAGKVEKLWRSE